jgi:hypothetical protein
MTKLYVNDEITLFDGTVYRQKKIRHKIFPLLFFLGFGSGIRDGRKSGSGIIMTDPQH